MLKRNLVSFAALGVFTVLAFGSKQSSTSSDDLDDLFGEDFEKALEGAMEDAMKEGAGTEAGADAGAEAGAEAGAGASAGATDLADNVAACKYYVQTYNGLDCLKSAGIQLNADDVCPSGLNMSPLDMRDYYKCMADNSKCNGNIPDMSGVSGCSLPSM
jgi:uncharacterized lipoprotein NlpE involved in copper resistance